MAPPTSTATGSAIRLAAALAVAVALLWPSTASAQDEKGRFGIGLILGEPTGVSVKYYLTDTTALDGAVGGAFVGRGVQFHGDFLWHPSALIIDSNETFVLPAYVGIGARLLSVEKSSSASDHLRIGARFVAGLLFDFRKIPIDVFAEIAGTADFLTLDDDKFGIGFNAGGGVRYYF